MMTKKNTFGSSTRLHKLVMAAMFVAVAYVFRFVFHFNAMFLTFEFKDAIITIGAMFLGPLWGIGMALSVAFIEFITISETGIYGLIMNALAASAYAGISALVYKYRRTMGGAIWSLAAGTAVLVAVMLPANLLITPYFMGASVDVVIDLIPKLLFPFNLIKGAMNSGVVLLLYKPVTRALRAVGLAEASVSGGNNQTRSTWKKWLVPVVAVLLIALSALFFFLFLHGDVSFGK